MALDDADFHDQDTAETLDEDNTSLEEQRYGGHENEETFEDLVDVFDATQASGDSDDDDALTNDDLDDDEIVELERDSDQDDADADDDNLRRRDPDVFEDEDEGEDTDLDDGDLDAADGVGRTSPGEVELVYAGDLTDAAGAEASAADLESEELSDADLRELDYQDSPTSAEEEGSR